MWKLFSTGGGKYAAREEKAKGGVLGFVLAVISLCLTGWLLQTLLFGNSNPGAIQNTTTDYAMMDRYEMQMTNAVSNALDGVLSIKKTYWLSDNDQVAPEPNQDNFGTTDDPSTLGWLLEEAETLL